MQRSFFTDSFWKNNKACMERSQHDVKTMVWGASSTLAVPQIEKQFPQRTLSRFPGASGDACIQPVYQNSNRAINLAEHMAAQESRQHDTRGIVRPAEDNPEGAPAPAAQRLRNRHPVTGTSRQGPITRSRSREEANNIQATTMTTATPTIANIPVEPPAAVPVARVVVETASDTESLTLSDAFSNMDMNGGHAPAA